MKAINLNFSDLIIKALLILYSLGVCFGVAVFLVWFFKGNAILLEDNIVISSLPIQSTLEFKHVLVFGTPILIESLIMVYILFKLGKIVKQFKLGFVFNNDISNQLKQIANWVAILVFIKLFLKFFLELILLSEFNIELSTDFLIDLLLVALVYIIADMVSKGAQLKNENDLTI